MSRVIGGPVCEKYVYWQVQVVEFGEPGITTQGWLSKMIRRKRTWWQSSNAGSVLYSFDTVRKRAWHRTQKNGF